MGTVREVSEMSRYIDADKLEKAIRKRVYAVEVEDILAEISNTPTIDLDTDVWCEDCKEYDKENHKCPRFNRVIRTALEDAGMVRVVRCKECKHWIGETEHYEDREYKACWQLCGQYMNSEFWCKYGEREGE